MKKVWQIYTEKRCRGTRRRRRRVSKIVGFGCVCVCALRETWKRVHQVRLRRRWWWLLLVLLL